MKQSLKEQLERVHSLTYGKENIKESNLLDKVMGNLGLKNNKSVKIDDPKKADLVSTDVDEFFKTLTDASSTGGLTQQNKGSMGYQKSVESMQIGLKLLGFELPKHGIDGLFGPETAEAVRQFKTKHLTLKESSSELRNTLDTLGYDEKGSEISSGGEISGEISDIVSEILKSYKATNPKVKVIVTSGNDKFHKNVGYVSKHSTGDAVDVVLQPYNSTNAKAFINILNDYKSKNSKFTYIDEYTNPSKSSTGGHFHLQYGTSKPKGGKGVETASPEMLNKLVELLKQRGVKSEELKGMIDTVTTGGGSQFVDIDLTTEEGVERYKNISQKFIDTRQPNPLGITGEMMSNAAKRTFEKYGKFVPAELALSQMVLEGGIGNGDVTSRPIRTKNPFNVGNVDNGKNQYFGNVQSAINMYYDLIAKNYLGKGKTATDLTKNFVNKDGNRYASASSYEQKLNQLVGQVNKVSQSIT
jgi:peptidoglycan hydrolase-like protein with peptidoglycan-binding domain